MRPGPLPAPIQSRLLPAPAPDLRRERDEELPRSRLDAGLLAFHQRQCNLAFLLVLARDPLEQYLLVQAGGGVAEPPLPGTAVIETPHEAKRTGERGLMPGTCRRLAAQLVEARGGGEAGTLDPRRLDRAQAFAARLVLEVDASVLLAAAAPAPWAEPDDEGPVARALRAALAHEAARVAALHGRLVLANTPLVQHAVSKYFPDLEARGIDPEDCVQEGMIGLGKAIAKFLPSHGGSLSTYAVHWICNHVRRYVDNCERFIRIPVNRVQSWARIREYKAAHPSADTEAIVEALRLPLGEVLELQHVPDVTRFERRPGIVGEDGPEAVPSPEDPYRSPDGSREFPGTLGLLADSLRALPAPQRLLIGLKFGLDDAREAAASLLATWADASLRFSANLANTGRHERLELAQREG